MDISHETPEQTQKRLLQVIAHAQLHILDGTYAFEEFLLSDFLHRVTPSALALTRDDEVWSQLVPSTDSTQELCTILRFHFATGLDNSGFVGWLASHLKARLGTGVFVVCGSNSQRGGIFDYWGCPVAVGSQVIAEVEHLRKEGSL